MTIHGFSQTYVTPLLRKWWLIVTLGVAISLVGILLLASPFDAVRTLALLVGLALAISGVDEIVQAERHEVKWPSYVLGGIWLVTAIVAMSLPGLTVLMLAVTVGVGFIVGGLAETFFALRMRRELPMWAVYVLDGACSVIVGIFALAWPGATVIVLAILLGLKVLFRGIATTVFGLAVRQIYRTTQRTNS